jgi:hypothetical protein
MVYEGKQKYCNVIKQIQDIPVDKETPIYNIIVYDLFLNYITKWNVKLKKFGIGAKFEGKIFACMVVTQLYFEKKYSVLISRK